MALLRRREEFLGVDVAYAEGAGEVAVAVHITDHEHMFARELLVADEGDAEAWEGLAAEAADREGGVGSSRRSSFSKPDATAIRRLATPPEGAAGPQPATSRR